MSFAYRLPSVVTRYRYLELRAPFSVSLRLRCKHTSVPFRGTIRDTGIALGFDRCSIIDISLDVVRIPIYICTCIRLVSNERRSRIRRRKENVGDSKLVSLICVSMLTVRLQPFENDRPSWLRSKPRANSKRLQTLSRTVLRATRSNPFTVRLGSWSTVRFASATRFTRNYSEES